MARNITKMFIGAYRGMKNLELNNLGDINIVVGDNNSGKTSLLEAIQVVCSPHDIANIAYVAKQRETLGPGFFRASNFSSLVSSLAKDNDKYHLHIESNICGKTSLIKLIAHIEKNIVDSSEMLNRSDRVRERAIEEEVEVLTGTIKSRSSQWQLSIFDGEEKRFEFHKYSRPARPRDRSFPVEYLSPINHIAVNTAPSVIRNKTIHDKTVEILQFFDSDIVDLRADVDDDTLRKTWIIEHKKLGYMPLTSYGDGTKKVVSLAGTIASMSGGILLIDEFETSIHAKAMEPVFTFLFKVCKQKEIQLFLTTHSIEALDKALKYCDDLHALRIVMLEKKDTGTFAQIIDGKRAQNLRFDNDAELR